MSVSVIIPVYNRAHSICAAVESVLSQTHSPDEIIVVDDGSTDETPAVLRKFQGAITIIRQDNKGVSAARNAGINLATGDWITFLDSDDVWYPNRLAVLHRDIEGTTAGVHIANVVFTGPGYEKDLFLLRGLDYPDDKSILVEQSLSIALAGPVIVANAIRRDWIVASNGFDETMRIYEDAHLFYRVALLGPWLITSEIVAEARRIDGDANALSNQAYQEPVYAASMGVKLFEDLCNMPNLPTAQTAAIKRRLSDALLKLAEAYANSEDNSNWHQMLLRSAHEHPSLKGWIKVLPPLIWGVKGFGFFPKQHKGFFRTKAGA